MRNKRETEKTTRKKIGNILASAAFILAVALLIFTAFTVVESKNDPKNTFLFGYKPVIVETGSMSPYILPYSMVIIKKTDFALVKPGDVVTYELDGQFITHRAVSADGHLVIVKGDANTMADPQTVTPQNFVGTAAYTLNWTQPVISGFNNDPVSAAIRFIGFPVLAIVLICFIISMVRKFLRAGKQEDEKTFPDYRKDDASGEEPQLERRRHFSEEEADKLLGLIREEVST